MPVIKFASGHGPSVRPAIDYLTRDGRAVAADFINCWEVDWRGRSVWQQMDECRHALCCDVPTRGHETVRTWEHVVLSPDPADHVDLPTLRDLARAWAERHFGAYQVAIYYHDDNALRIPHAHLIINNANTMRPGRRLTAELTPKGVDELFDSLQEMAAERGLSALERRGGRERGTVQPTYRTRRDVELEAKDVSWKRDVRDRISCALALSSTEGEYVEAARCLGLGVRVSESRRNRGEYVYRHPAAGREVSGPVLGSDWSREGIVSRLERDRVLGVDKPRGQGRERLLEAVSALKPEDGVSLRVLGTTRGVEVTSRMVADMVATCAAWDVRSLEDLRAARSEATGASERRSLAEAERVARALGHLPDARPAARR